MDKNLSSQDQSGEPSSNNDDQPIRLPVNDTQSVERLRPSQMGNQNAELIVKGGIDNSLTGDELDADQEKEWGDSSSKSLGTGWVVLAILLIAGLITWGGINVFKAKESKSVVEGEKSEEIQESIEDLEEIRSIQGNLEEVTRRYLGATSIEEKLKYSRDAKRVKPLMEQFYQDQELEVAEFSNFGKMSGFSQYGIAYLIATINTSEGKKNLIIEELPEGGFLVDWEMDVYFQPIEWDDFLQTRPTAPHAMRVLVRKDNFYAYEFRDEKKYQCYRITDRSKGHHVFAYLERGSDLMKKIELTFYRYSAPQLAMILKIKFPKDGDAKNTVMIDEFLSDRWIYPSKPKRNLEGK